MRYCLNIMISYFREFFKHRGTFSVSDLEIIIAVWYNLVIIFSEVQNMPIFYNDTAKSFRLTAKDTCYVMQVAPGGYLAHTHTSERLCQTRSSPTC